MATVIKVKKLHVRYHVVACSPVLYQCEGPDGIEYDNTSIVTLRKLLKQRYGKDTVIEVF